MKCFCAVFVTKLVECCWFVVLVVVTAAATTIFVTLINIIFGFAIKTLIQKWGERIFSNKQLDRRVSIRIVMIMGLE